MKIIKIIPWAEIVQEKRDLLKRAEEDVTKLEEKIREQRRLISNLSAQLREQRRNRADPYLVNATQSTLRLNKITLDSLYEDKGILEMGIEELKIDLSSEDE